MSIGFVYILTNAYMSGVYKVGCTEKSPHARADELSRPTGVPYPFTVLCYIEVDAFQEVERAAHKWLNNYRISEQREFFNDGLDRAVGFLYWHPRRLSFAYPKDPGHFSGYIDGLYNGEFDPLHIDDCMNPWAPPAPPAIPADPAEEMAAKAIQVAKASSEGEPF